MRHTLEEYKRVADEGYTQSQAARLFGVSRQYVSELAKKHGIVFHKKDKRGGNNRSKKVLWSDERIKLKWENVVERI
ncbi:MAG: hypothetical protein CL959_05305 [Euryarchaeota archaeon]|nr:hypothetical protein [Euryarchaeota archaeon]|tara:strand:- start:1288 stop:1518 length:231 start_codon:yes stop_codon:yes gene_type:complete